MMPIEQATMPILAAAAANVVVPMIWYSDHLFGPMWKKLGGKTSPDKNFYNNLVVHGVAALVASTALYIAIVVFQKTQVNVYSQAGFGKIFGMFLTDSSHNNELMCALKIAAFLWLGVLVPNKVACTAWGSGNWTKTAVSMSGKLVTMLTMAAVIASMS